MHAHERLLVIRVIILELTQHIRPRYINVTDGQTTYDSNTALALRASRGKKTGNMLYINLGLRQQLGGCVVVSKQCGASLRLQHGRPLHFYHGGQVQDPF